MTKEQLETEYLKVFQERELLVITLTNTIMSLSSAINRLPKEINFPIRVIIEATTPLNPDAELPVK